MAPGSIIMVHSTVRPSTIEELAGAAAVAGVDLIDVCVSAGALGKSRLDRVAIVGADAGTYRRCAEVLNEIGTPVLAGGPGSASRVKLLNNLLTTATVGTTEVALRVGELAGIDRRVLQRVFLSGSAASTPLSMMVRRPDPTSHRYRMLRKDLDLAVSSLGPAAADGRGSRGQRHSIGSSSRCGNSSTILALRALTWRSDKRAASSALPPMMASAMR